MSISFISDNASFIPKLVDTYIPPTFQGWCPPLTWGDIRFKSDFRFKNKEYFLMVAYSYPGKEIEFLTKGYFLSTSEAILLYNTHSFHSVFYIKEFISKMIFNKDLHHTNPKKTNKNVYMLVEYVDQNVDQDIDEHILELEIKSLKVLLQENDFKFCSISGELTDKEFKKSIIGNFIDYYESLKLELPVISELSFGQRFSSKVDILTLDEYCFNILTYSEDSNLIKQFIENYSIINDKIGYFLPNKEIFLIKFKFKDKIAYIDLHLPRKGLQNEFLKETYLITEYQIQLFFYNYKNLKSILDVKERAKKLLYWKELEEFSYNVTKRKNFLLVFIETIKTKENNEKMENELEKELKNNLDMNQVDNLFFIGDIRNKEFIDHILERIFDYHISKDFKI